MFRSGYDWFGFRKEGFMPEQETMKRAREDAREGKSPSTQAGEFVREEIHHIREGKHGARSAKQAIAIGLSKARRAGVKLGQPKASAELRKKAAQGEKASKNPRRRTSATRSRATEAALKREPRNSVSKSALSRQTKKAAALRGKNARNAAAAKAARTRRAS
jgi:Family of unknown function (DUF6496)